MEILFGRPLGRGRQANVDFVLSFLENCTSAEFLDFMELIFKADAIWRLRNDYRQLIDDFNEFFKADRIPYAMTSFFGESGGYSSGTTHQRHVRPRISAYPQIIRRDSDVLHETAIQPALALLRYSGFETANQEYLGALNHYRNGEYGESVLKCQNSFESVMKIICEQKGWTYKRHDTLLTEVVQKSNLPPFFRQPLALIGTIRTELGASHGAGTESREISQHVAQYAINATASAILLLVGETNPLANDSAS